MPADYEPPILYARDSQDAYRYIDDVQNGDACGCFCPACGQPMRARNAGQKRRHSFAHQPGMTCTWAVEAVIAALAKQAIEESGRMAMPALYYENAVTGGIDRLSESRLMKVSEVELVTLAGRLAPCLVVTVQGGGKTARFGLCITLRRKLTIEQEEQLLGDTRGIVLVDLGVDLARQRKELGRHYDRDELILGYQDKDRLSEILLEQSSDLMDWIRNARRDEYEMKSAAEKAELDRKEAKARAEAEREYEEARKREEEAREREARERTDREAHEGIVREPDNFVTEYDEYDVRRWGDKSIPSGHLRPGERLVYNGGLLALILKTGDTEGVRVLMEMSLDALDEISWNYGELSRDFEEFTLVLNSEYLQLTKVVEITATGGEYAQMSFTSDARAYCCALQGLLYQGARLIVSAKPGGSWQIMRVDVNAGTVRMSARG